MASKRLKKKKQAAAVLQKRTEPENGAVKTERPGETREQTPEEETKQGIYFQIETDLKKESEEMKTMTRYLRVTEKNSVRRILWSRSKSSGRPWEIRRRVSKS